MGDTQKRDLRNAIHNFEITDDLRYLKEIAKIVRCILIQQDLTDYEIKKIMKEFY